jgi:MFS transporter, DHA2 family, multidrug resistance protein
MSNSPSEAIDQPHSTNVRKWGALIALCLGAFVVSMDVFSLLLALPSITRTLHANATEQLWITDIYGFTLVGLLLASGSLADRIGRRRLLMIGSAGFAIASAVAAFSSTPEMLIAARALLGAAGATIAPSTLGIISHLFPESRQRSTAISLWLVAFMAGSGVGPIIGGALLAHFSWNAIFFVPIPVLLALIVVAPIVIPRDQPNGKGRVDIVSVLLSLATILPIVWGIKELASTGPSIVEAAAAVAGLSALLFFVRRQRRLPDPLLDLALFHSKMVATTIGTMILVTMMSATLFFGAQYLQLVAGLTPLQSALIMIPSVLASVVSFLFAPKLAVHMRPAFAIAGGMVLAATGAIIFASAGVHDGTLNLLVGLVLLDLGYGPILALGTDLVVSAAPPERASSAASVSESSTEFGGALGIALLGSLAAAIYRVTIALPGGLSHEQVRAASGSLSGALAVSLQLSNPNVLSAARFAFVTSMHAAGWATALIAVTVAVITLFKLRGAIVASNDNPQASDIEVADDQNATSSSIENSNAPDARAVVPAL